MNRRDVHSTISIITPHFNYVRGLQHIYADLQNQTSDSWEWIIVDDLSAKGERKALQVWVDSLNDKRITLICNSEKTNASVCRNIGADKARSDNLVFLDSDDTILKDFVANRLIEFKDFAIFGNYALKNSNGSIQNVELVKGNHLNYFLKGRFLWQTSLVLWEKSFFNAIGQFNPKLPRLQDVELAIRGLQASSEYTVIDNPVDFYYNVIPIRERKNFLEPVCRAVYLFVSEILDKTQLDKQQIELLAGYYFLCVKYLERSGSTSDIGLVRRNLNLLFKTGSYGMVKWFLGQVFLIMYSSGLLTPTLFLRLNRKVFKPT